MPAQGLLEPRGVTCMFVCRPTLKERLPRVANAQRWAKICERFQRKLRLHQLMSVYSRYLQRE